MRGLSLFVVNHVCRESFARRFQLLLRQMRTDLQWGRKNSTYLEREGETAKVKAALASRSGALDGGQPALHVRFIASGLCVHGKMPGIYAAYTEVSCIISAEYPAGELRERDARKGEVSTSAGKHLILILTYPGFEYMDITEFHVGLATTGLIADVSQLTLAGTKDAFLQDPD